MKGGFRKAIRVGVFFNILTMKKFIIGCCLFCFIAVHASAQIPTFLKDDNVVGVGVGFGGNIYVGKYYTNNPSISVHYERCILDNLFDEKSFIGVGGVVGYTSSTYKYPYGSSYWGWKYSSIIIGARAALHYAFVDKLDTYAGVILGFNIVSKKEIGTHTDESKNITPSSPTSYLLAGARYYLTDNFAVFAEVCPGWNVFSIINLGVSLKF
jgi:hypothetical protein